MAPEPWHISFAPAAEPALRALTPEVIARALEGVDLFGRDVVVERLPALYQRYVINVAPFRP